ncbi:MAG: ABC transporter ATP-binding protein [Parachlamydiales bacterium]|jgi:ABC-type glutathione transport system ATPase component
MESNQPLLQVTNLNIRLEDKPLLSDVSFDVFPAERIALVGPSGSGKSLTVSAIAKLLPRKQSWEISGNILWENTDLVKANEKQMLAFRKQGIAFIPQEALCCLNPSMKIGKQLQEIAPNEDPAEWLSEVGIHNPEQAQWSYPHEFSGGMCQRVVLAIALASKPKLLLADEFTSALDTVSQVQILQLLDKLCTRYNTALLAVTHDKNIAAKLCSKSYRMDKGRLSVA